MPVVHPGPLHDMVVLLLTDFPATVVRIVDNELADVPWLRNRFEKIISAPFRH